MAGKYSVTVYGRWGSEPYGSYATLDKAKEKARVASSLDPRDEFVVEWGEPGGGDAITYKDGKRVGGEGDRSRRRPARKSRTKLTRRQTSVFRRKMKTLSREKRPQKQKVAIAYRYARKSKRDVSRVDLKHLSGAALLKLLRQAIRKGDEDMAEAIGKELDRRSKF